MGRQCADTAGVALPRPALPSIRPQRTETCRGTHQGKVPATPLVDTFGRHFWSTLLVDTFGRHLWSTPLVDTFGRHRLEEALGRGPRPALCGHSLCDAHLSVLEHLSSRRVAGWDCARDRASVVLGDGFAGIQVMRRHGHMVSHCEGGGVCVGVWVCMWVCEG
jgi:hypothetical protein